MRDKYSVVYIDDSPDTNLTWYLDKEFHNDDYEIICSEIRYNPEEGYESLLTNPKVRSANIILVDSWLFENRTATGGKFTGEEFKLILKKLFPFIEVIVITQNDASGEIDKIAKYDRNFVQSATEYYSSVLPQSFNAAVANIKQYWLLSEIVKQNDIWEEVLKNKVIAALSGTSTYDELKKTDIDNLISAFKEIQECLNG